MLSSQGGRRLPRVVQLLRHGRRGQSAHALNLVDKEKEAILPSSRASLTQPSSPLTAPPTSTTSPSTTPPTSSPLLKLSIEDALPQETGGSSSAFTGVEFQERLDLIDVCLRMHEVECAGALCVHAHSSIQRAQMLFGTTCANYPMLARKYVDIHVHNSFLSAFLGGDAAQFNFREALKWFHQMRRSESHGLTLKPNITTYAILMKGALRADREDVIRVLTQDMRKNLSHSKLYANTADRTVERELLDNPHLQHDDARALARIFKIEDPRWTSLAYQEAEQQLGGAEKLEEQASFRTLLERHRETVDAIPEVKSSHSPYLKHMKQTIKPLDTGRAPVASMEGETAAAATSRQAISTAFDLQVQLEASCREVSVECLFESKKELQQRGVNVMPREVRKLLDMWQAELTPRISRMILRGKKAVGMAEADLAYTPYLSLFESKPDVISAITISTVLKSFYGAPEHVSAGSLLNSVGGALENEFKMTVLRRPRFLNKLKAQYLANQELISSKAMLTSADVRQMAAEKETDAFGNLISKPWSSTVRLGIGSQLMALFNEIVRVPVHPDLPQVIKLPSTMGGDNLTQGGGVEPVWEPALQHAIINRRGRSLGVFTIHEALDSAINASISTVLGTTSDVYLNRGLLPMVVPPQPWLSYDRGGYITLPSVCIRRMTGEAEAYMKEGTVMQSLTRFYNGLDVLGRTAWRVHDRLLAHLVHAWNNGMTIGKLPADIPERFEEPPLPADYGSDVVVRRRYNMERDKLRKEYFEAKSLRATENYKLEIARAFSGMPIYFPYSVDFRGRAYPIPPHFNHLGNDISRSLLVFEQPKRLGHEGLRWLKIHLANVFGNDKLTFVEREQFIDANMDKVMASVDDPFGPDEATHGWWRGADKPWLTLGVAIDLVDAVRSGKPEEHMSRTPIHQDGSCNGLQHYAALGGDIQGAIQVNLAPGFDRPQDVYSEVALRVREMIAADAKYEPTEEEKQAAAVRNGEFNHRCPVIRKQMAALFPPELVERKTVKQTVMTTVYGVTPYGASIQVRNRIKEKHPDAYTDEQTSHISRYITPKIFDALRNMFSGAREIQDWLAVAATQVAKSVSRERVNKTRAMESQAKLMRKRAKLKGLELDKASKTSVSLNSDSSVIWTTPLGLTVIQPYRAEKRYAVRTFTQSVTLKNTHLRSPVNVVKQRAAFPPNFIHSLDATHMLMTAITCGEMTENPITFAAVHDSYWTHACDVERLRDILRDEFVKMHSQPVMQQLYDEFVERYKDRLVQRIVPIDRDAPVKVEEGEEVVSPEELSQEQLAEAVIAKADADAIAMGESASASTFLGSLHDDLVDSDEPTSASAEDPLLLGLGEEEEELIDTVPEEKPRKISKNQKYVRRWEPVQFPPLPKRGTFNIADVAKSEYFFN